MILVNFVHSLISFFRTRYHKALAILANAREQVDFYDALMDLTGGTSLVHLQKELTRLHQAHQMCAPNPLQHYYDLWAPGAWRDWVEGEEITVGMIQMALIMNLAEAAIPYDDRPEFWTWAYESNIEMNNPIMRKAAFMIYMQDEEPNMDDHVRPDQLKSFDIR